MCRACHLLPDDSPSLTALAARNPDLAAQLSEDHLQQYTVDLNALVRTALHTRLAAKLGRDSSASLDAPTSASEQQSAIPPTTPLRAPRR
jgi:hypothetical protein